MTMDATRFGLRRRPFPATPDPACYYPADGHEQALAQLLQGLADDEGMLQFTGAPGVGKTLLCHCLLERLGPEATTAFLTNSHFRDRTGLLQAILYELSLPYEHRGEQEMRLVLTDHLLKHFAAERRPIVLIVDEAQHLDADLLEELRMLANLEAPGGRALQVVLVGQPSLVETLAQAGAGRPAATTGGARRSGAPVAGRSGRLPAAPPARSRRPAGRRLRR